jgi:Cof subfamily protein (haloacid dehalogenase superfamily)
MEPFPYRLAAIDLDDTLLGPDKRISVDNAAAVQWLREQGVRVVLASGRRHENMLRFHHELNLEGPIISCQGGLVRNAETDEILYKCLMRPDLAAEVVEQAEAEGVTLAYYHLDGTLIREHNAMTDLYQFRTKSPVIERGDLRQLAGETPIKIVSIRPPEQAARALPLLMARYDGRLEIVQTDPEYIEFLPLGVSKAVGMATVAERYGIAQAETLAFGDGNNDVPMLQWAGLGIAMDHGRPSAQLAADRIAPPGDPETSFARAVALVV